jgi:hypothetical protein
MTVREHNMQHRASPYLVLIATLVFAALFFSGIAFTPNSQTEALDQIATVVGMSASVPSNEYSQLAQQLTAREQALSDREAALVLQEETQRGTLNDDVRRANARTLIVLSVALVILFVLVMLNFYFDIRRHQRESEVHGNGHEGELQTRL